MQQTQLMTKCLVWAATTMECAWASVALPGTIAGQNLVLLVQTSTGVDYVLRVSPMHLYEDTGPWIRKQLGRLGVVVPQELARTVLSENENDGSAQYQIVVQSRVPGQDLDRAWPTLSHPQALNVAGALARTVQASCATFAPYSPPTGFGPFFPNNDHTSITHPDWYAYCNAWCQWAGNRARNKGSVSASVFNQVTERLHQHQEALLDTACSTFVWDVAERNVMVQDGAFSGIVDQDELFHGDPLVVPALALCQLSLLAVPWAAQYAEHWLSCWNANEQQRHTMHLYACLYALQKAGKDPRTLLSQQIEPNVATDKIEGLIQSWLQA